LVRPGLGGRGRGLDGFYGVGYGRGDDVKRDIPIQNIPIHTEIGKQIREAFRPPVPTVVLMTDYNGLELQIAALAGMDPDNLTECSDDGKCLYHALGGDVYDPCSGRIGS
jgi:hypothetical protein